ncbi:hypothetical protein [Roseixanthobacter liquoris]|uniref:hypothetical protein n=1 Tax=Roseixanthobacter liquoris TaxID=3119921 RepID=UPI00372A0240
MPNTSRLLQIAFALGSMSLLAGCADYLKRSDMISDAAGEAQSWNKVVQTTDPWPPYVMDTKIPGNGQRVSKVMARYTAGPASSTSSAPSADGPSASAGASADASATGAATGR